MQKNLVADTDDGFSLIEVLVALTLVIVVMASVSPYLIKSFAFVALQRGDQVASQLANSTLEQVRALKPSALVSGRSQAEAAAQFAAAPAVPELASYLSQITPAYDPHYATNDEEISTDPKGQPVTVDTTTYTRRIFVGECQIYIGGDAGEKSSCLKADKGSTDDASKYLSFYRAVVLVTWSDRLCNAYQVPGDAQKNKCAYVASTLISNGADPTFDVNRPFPVINRQSLDPIYFYMGGATSYQLPVYGGTLPNTWTLLPTMPQGLSVNQGGLVTGTPTKLGNTATKGTITDATTPVGRSTTKDLNFTVVATPGLALPDVNSHLGETLSIPVVVTGGTPNLKCTLTGQATGLSLATTADPRSFLINGTYSGSDTVFTPAVRCVDHPGSVNDRSVIDSFTHIFYPALQLTVPAAQKVTLGSAFNGTATGSGGDAKFTYSATGLPLGVSINATTGVMTGTPTIPGRYVPAIKVTDGIGGTLTKTFVVTVETTTSLIFTSPALTATDPTSTVGAFASMTFSTNAGLLGLTSTMTATGLPTGMTFNALTRTISGTPSKAGQYPVTVVATTLLPPSTSNYNFIWTVQ
jgi:prepilin-type N-terminal cleavage/methylation domain-containing protein